MDLILLALIIAGIVWAVRNRARLRLPGKSSEKVTTTQVSGVVTGTSRHVETTVSGGGSGTYGGRVNMSVSSTSVLHQQFFVRRDDGVEKPVRTWGQNLPIADGQRVTVIYAEARDQSVPGYIVNHTARQGWPMFSRPQDIAVRLGVAPATPMIFVRAIAAAMAVIVVAWILSGISAMAAFAGMLGAPVVFLVVLFGDRSRRRGIGASLMQDCRNQERELLAAREVPAA